MCRVLIRQSAHQPREAGVDAAPFSVLEELRGGFYSEAVKLEDPGFGFDSLTNSTVDSFEDDLDLFSMFEEVPQSLQAACPAPVPEVAGAAAPGASISMPVNLPGQGGLPGPMFNMPSFLPGPPLGFPSESAFHANFLAQQNAALTGVPCSTDEGKPAASAACEPRPAVRRARTESEVAEQVERTKKRRRESAQRSRTRRNCYMKALETENAALKAELARLRGALVAGGMDAGACAVGANVSSSSVTANTPHTGADSSHVLGDTQSALLCPEDSDDELDC